MPMHDVTQLLSAMEQGDTHASNQLLPLVYEELRKLAHARLAHEKVGHTLQATALVHEAYLRLVDDEKARHWNSRGHFFMAAAEAMRRILIDRARARLSDKRGGDRQRANVEVDRLLTKSRQVDLLELNDVLSLLEEQHPRPAQVVKLRYFAGLTISEAAAALGIAESTADADWAFAKSWLRVRLADAEESIPGKRGENL